jgi:hypothetical protein
MGNRESQSKKEEKKEHLIAGKQWKKAELIAVVSPSLPPSPAAVVVCVFLIHLFLLKLFSPRHLERISSKEVGIR